MSEENHELDLNSIGDLSSILEEDKVTVSPPPTHISVPVVIPSIDTNDQHQDINFQVEESPFSLSLRIKSFFSEKDFDKFVKGVDKLVRSSSEYRSWVQYIIEVQGQTSCALTGENIGECVLDVHHHPINLYTITKCVISDFISKSLSFNSFDIATKVIELHYLNKVGYILLLSDLHKKFHEGFQKLPIELVKGDYKYILHNYNIEEEDRKHISELCNTHAEDVKLTWSKDNYPGVKNLINKGS